MSMTCVRRFFDSKSSGGIGKLILILGKSVGKSRSSGVKLVLRVKNLWTKTKDRIELDKDITACLAREIQVFLFAFGFGIVFWKSLSFGLKTLVVSSSEVKSNSCVWYMFYMKTSGGIGKAMLILENDERKSSTSIKLVFMVKHLW